MGTAFSTGFQLGVSAIERGNQIRENELSQEREFQFKDLINTRDKLSTRLSGMNEGDPLYGKLNQQLIDTNVALKNFWHPDKTPPGALAKDFSSWAGKHIPFFRRNPQLAPPALGVSTEPGAATSDQPLLTMPSQTVEMPAAKMPTVTTDKKTYDEWLAKQGQKEGVSRPPEDTITSAETPAKTTLAAGPAAVPEKPAAGAHSTLASAIAKAEGSNNYNNPGNLKVGDKGLGTTPNGITKFKTPEEGWAALENQVQSILSGAGDKYKPGMTIAQVAELYAKENAQDVQGPKNWANNVATALGATPDASIADAAKGGAAAAPPAPTTETFTPPTGKPVSMTTEETVRPQGTMGRYAGDVAINRAMLSPRQRQLLETRDWATKQAALEVATAGGSPREKAQETMRTIDTELDEYDSGQRAAGMPPLDPEERAKMRKLLFFGALGIKEPTAGAGTYQMKTGRFGTSKELQTVLVNAKDPSDVQYVGGQKVDPDLAKTFTEVKGKAGAKGLKFIKASRSIHDEETGHDYYEGVASNPPEVQAMFAGVRSAEQIAFDFQSRITAERGKAYNDSRIMDVIDANGNATTIQYSDFKKAAEDATKLGKPAPYLPQKDYNLWAPRANLMEDLRGGSRIVRQDIETLQAQNGFDFGDLGNDITKALSAEHPSGAVDALIHTGALSNLTAAQQKYVIDTAALNEQAMSMRTILGAGGGAQDIRQAILGTLPNVLSPSGDYAVRQMDQFDGTLERLHRSIPTNILLAGGRQLETPWTVQAKPSPYSELSMGGEAPAGGGGGAAGAGTTPASTGVRKSVGAMKAYFNAHPDQAVTQFGTRTPTDSDIANYIRSRGGTPMQ